jgi:glucose/arabinose dehydrogenase
MKKIFALILILCVAVTIFAACGEKTEEQPVTDETTTTEVTTDENTEKPADTTAPAAGTFENAVFSVALPEGWTANEDPANASVFISKANDPMSVIMVVFNTANTDSVETISEAMSNGAPVEDATIGANTFKKFSMKVQENEVTNLVAVKGSNGIIFTVQNFAGTDEQAILGSLNLK